ncbi:MMPL family transporter [Jatrophihabitans sp.]|uniref:MMPL family transporter n=1 Tax=Jatrophihabitans sp. TaxID=1932789 RepID=UPI0030C69A46|nr:rane protein [Jatrophihabitans sp.]
MLTRLANLGIRHPKRLLGLAGLLLVLAAVYGAPAASHLASGGFYDTGAESGVALNTLTNTFHTGDPNLVLEVSSPAGANSSATRTVGIKIADDLQHQRFVSQVSSYWTAPAAQAAGLRSHDGKAGLIAVRVVGNDNEAPKRAYDMYKSLVGTHDGVTVKAGGIVATVHTVNQLTTSDLAKSEAIAIPITVVVLILVFGSFVAALLPLVVGISSIVGTMALLRGLGRLTDVSIYALNMTTAMGLALAIDYSLFIISRYREEIRNGADADTAIRTTMRTAGRTVLFSALTVGLSLAAMLVFPMYFLRSFAYAGIGVVGLATLAALVLLPAMLKILGPRVDALDLRAFLRRRFGRPAPAIKPLEQTFWYRFATAVMRRALPIGLVVTALLVGLGLPFLHANFGFPDDRVVPSTEAAHQVGDDLRTNFSTNAASTISIVVPDLSAAPDGVASYAGALSKVTDITSVSAVTGTYADGRQVAAGNPAMKVGEKTYLNLETSADAQSTQAKDTLAALRRVAAPWRVQFTGQTAVNQDSLSALGTAMPYAIGIIALATFLILFLFTGSLVLPIKALVLNTLSLSATFGAMVWIFQDGHLASLYGNLTTTGDLNATMPPLMFCVAFGLSMDYEVFLLSRIREAWLESDRTTAANTHAVAVGLGRTGRIVTAAAALMAIVFAAIADARVSFMMLFGTGLTLAVLMDATIVRGVLVPAFMRLAGRWNWWAPKPLAALHERFGLAEAPPAPAEERIAVNA